jgi:putative FmdB family regulatory protein
MPLYEYECDACGHRFEAIQKFSDPPLTACPRCEGPVHKLQSAPAFQLKGSGWYITDYARKDQPKAEGGAGGGKAEGGKPGEAARESGEGAAKSAPAAASKDASPSSGSSSSSSSSTDQDR